MGAERIGPALQRISEYNFSASNNLLDTYGPLKSWWEKARTLRDSAKITAFAVPMFIATSILVSQIAHSYPTPTDIFSNGRWVNGEQEIILSQRGIDINISRILGRNGFASWNEDCQTLLFISNEDGDDFDIYFLRLEDLSYRQITDNEIYDGGPIMTLDCSGILYVSGNHVDEIFKSDLNAGNTSLVHSDSEG